MASIIYVYLGKRFYQLGTGGDTERLHACMGSPSLTAPDPKKFFRFGRRETRAVQYTMKRQRLTTSV